MAAPPTFTVPAGEQSLGRGHPPELLKVFPEEAEVLRFVPQDVGHFSIRLLLPVRCSLLGRGWGQHQQTKAADRGRLAQ